MSKRVLITGASGLLGRAIYKDFLSEGSWDVLGLAFKRCSGKLRKVDITKHDEVQAVMTEFSPTVVIHSAAERKTNVVESQPHTVQILNVSATRTLCQQAAAIGAWVLYISTDYVFDGKSPPYNEDASPNPLNIYGQSKYAGEKVTMDISQENGILRVPILYGQVKDLDESSVTTLFNKILDTRTKCMVSNYEKRYPTYCNDVATITRQLAEKRLSDSNIKGIYHYGGEEMATKYDMSIVMAKAFGLPTNHILPDNKPSSGTVRPYHSKLCYNRLKELGIYKTSQFKDTVYEALKEHYKA